MAFVQIIRTLPTCSAFVRSPRSLVRGARRMATTQASLSIAVKGDPEKKTLGDCPFCHRALLTMEQKNLDHDKIYIDLKNKPQWLLDVNPEGSVPVLKDDEKYVPDSGAIVEYLEEKFPSPAVPQNPEGLEAVNGIFGAFRSYFLNKDETKDEELKEALTAELKKLEEYLKTSSGPLMGGNTLDAADALILPRLYHMRVALGHFKQWTMPEDCPQVTEYMDAAAQTDAWKKCMYPESMIIEGWGSKL